MRVLDPGKDDIYKEGGVVDAFPVTGRVVELAIKQSLKAGLAGTVPGALPATIPFRLDRLGNRQVLVPETSKPLAVRIARHLRGQFISARVNLQAAVVPELGSLGEHDGIGDLVRDDAKDSGLTSIKSNVGTCGRRRGRTTCG